MTRYRIGKVANFESHRPGLYRPADGFSDVPGPLTRTKFAITTVSDISDDYFLKKKLNIH